MMQLGAERRTISSFRFERVVRVVDEMELERGCGARDVLRRARVLDAGQLNQDPVEALALHDGLGDAELVDAIAHRQHVLLDREILTLANRDLSETHVEPGAPVDLCAVDDQPARELAELEQLIALLELANDLLGTVHVARLGDGYAQIRADDAHVAADVHLAELRPQRALVRLEILRNGRVKSTW